MKENKGVPVHPYSKRAQDFLSSPRHLLANNPGEVVHDKWLWSFTLQKNQERDFQNDKILTLFYVNHSSSTLESLFLEALSLMVQGQNIFFLQQLSFRELENFLRDENHLPVFHAFDALSSEESFKAVKISLLSTLIIKEIEKKGEAFGHVKRWDHLTLVEKNQKAQAFIECVNNVFFEAKPLQLALAEKEKIAIVMNDFPIEALVIEQLFHQSFGNTEEISSLKVVAVQ